MSKAKAQAEAEAKAQAEAEAARRAELLEKARGHLKAHAEHSPGVLARTRPGYGYFTIRSDVGDTERRFYRQVCEERGFELCGEADEEFLPVDAGAEIWRCPPEVAALYEQDRHDYARCEGRWDGQGEHRWGAKMWRPQQKRRRLNQAME